MRRHHPCVVVARCLLTHLCDLGNKPLALADKEGILAWSLFLRRRRGRSHVRWIAGHPYVQSDVGGEREGLTTQ